MMRSIFKSTHNQKGFSLIELLIAMALFSMVVAGIVASRVSQQNQSMTQQQAVDLQQNVRAGLSMMVDEIRMAGYNPYKNEPSVVKSTDVGILSAGNGILIADGGTGPFTFAYVAEDDTTDNNGDGTIDEKGEIKTVSYSLISTDLTLNDGGTSKLLAQNISLLNFTYFDANNSPATAADFSDIRAITISITATTSSNELDRTDGTNNTRTLQTTVKCRNLGL